MTGGWFQISEGRKEIRSIVNNLPPFVQRITRGMCPVVKFGKENGMRLLPDEQRIARMGRFASIGTRHFGPPGTFEALPSRPLASRREKLLIDSQAAIENIPAVPERVVRGMPPKHLQVKLSVPAIVHQAALLRRHRPSLINRQKIL